MVPAELPAGLMPAASLAAGVRGIQGPTRRVLALRTLTARPPEHLAQSPPPGIACGRAVVERRPGAEVAVATTMASHALHATRHAMNPGTNDKGGKVIAAHQAPSSTQRLRDPGICRVPVGPPRPAPASPRQMLGPAQINTASPRMDQAGDVEAVGQSSSSTRTEPSWPVRTGDQRPPSPGPPFFFFFFFFFFFLKKKKNSSVPRTLPTTDRPGIRWSASTISRISSLKLVRGLQPHIPGQEKPWPDCRIRWSTSAGRRAYRIQT